MGATAGEIGEVLLWGCRCRCGHEWLPRGRGDKPRVCPKCKSPNWDRPSRARAVVAADANADQTQAAEELVADVGGPC